ncbi:recombinase family protein [Caloranaerobacter sp. DY30410]|uniref:recombinase family protein n=1 Tax=Caloranaerobacter sp. DY30410 TaxID=3238305 RepID=UPI003D05D01B
MKKVAIYIRVSTQEQANEGYSIQAQKDRLINYCKAKSWNIYDIYIDGGFSGSNLDRPALQKMLNQLKNIDIVLVYKLDRLSRSQKDTLYLIEEQFLPNNVDFVSLQESFDTTTPFGRAMIGILSVFAQLERETITERSRLGKLERAKEGLWSGGGPGPIGYDYIPHENRLKINEYEAMQVKELFELYVQGKGVRQIAKIFKEKGYKHKYGDWDAHPEVSMIRVIENPVYIGKIRHKDEVFDGQHEAIIDEDIWHKANLLLARRREKMRNNKKHKHLLNGFIWCGNCGARYVGHFSGSTGYKYNYYSCYSVRKIQKRMIKDPNCKNKTWRKEELEPLVLEKIKKINIDKNELMEIYNKSNTKKTINIDTHKIKENKIKQIDKQIAKLMDLYQDDKIPVSIISERIEKLYNEKKALENSINEVAATQDNNFDFEELYNIIQNFDEIWQEATFEEKRIILEGFIDKIIIYNDHIEVEGPFFRNN